MLFLDEMDALAPRRGTTFDSVSDKIIGQLLTELDGIEGRRGVIVVGATNRPELIDPAVLRSGRFDLLLDLPMPDRAARKVIFDIYTKRRPLASNVSLDALAKRSDGLSGADIEFVCRRAANLSVSEWVRAHGAEQLAAAQSGASKLTSPRIEMRHFEMSILAARNETGGKWG